MVDPKTNKQEFEETNVQEDNFETELKKGLNNTALAEKQEDRLNFAKEVESLILEDRKKLLELALVDKLTKAYNRRYFETAISRAVARETRNKNDGKKVEPFSILMLDLDKFKKVNDTYGHDMGDVVLQETVKFLKGSLKRETDIVCRYGGEEFVIILENTDETGAAHVAEKIRNTIEKETIKMEEEMAKDGKVFPRVTISVGQATFDPTKEELNSAGGLFKSADTAGYFSKKTGRNRTTAYSPKIKEEVEKIIEREKAEAEKNAKEEAELKAKAEAVTEANVEAMKKAIEKSLPPDLPVENKIEALEKMLEKAKREKDAEKTGTDD